MHSNEEARRLMNSKSNSLSKIEIEEPKNVVDVKECCDSL